MRLSAIVFLVSFIPLAAQAKQDLVKDPKGKTLAVIVDCNSCQDPGKGKDCTGGRESGYEAGADCGLCLLDSNFGTRIGYAYDVHVVGKLRDEAGKPLANRFVQVALPNTWRIRTRTLEDGGYRLMLGATLPKAKTDDIIIVDLGTRTMPSGPSGGDSQPYAFFLLQDGYKPCAKEEKK
jgi:hypothetical protein